MSFKADTFFHIKMHTEVIHALHTEVISEVISTGYSVKPYGKFTRAVFQHFPANADDNYPNF